LGQDERVIGAAVIVVVLVVILPVIILMVGAIVAIVLGSSLKADAERTHEGSELIDLNI
jgi:sensor domain CHASE-containing protein